MSVYALEIGLEGTPLYMGNDFVDELHGAVTLKEELWQTDLARGARSVDYPLGGGDSGVEGDHSSPG